MKFLYHKFNWHTSSQEGKIRFTDDNGNSMRLYKRVYNNQGAYYYMCAHVFPTLYIYSGDFIDQLYDYCQTVKSKCTENSITEAFSDCPNIYKLISDDNLGNCHIENMSIDGRTKKCLAVCYPSFLLTKELMYDRLAKKEEILKEEVRKIKKYELKGKWDTLKKFGAGVFKVAARVGVALVAGAVGANMDIDIPDFDFGGSMPDIDFDADIDFDNSDFSQDADYSNVSFGSNKPPHASSDGYIFQGGDKYNGFDVYKKQGHKYYWDSIKDIFVKIS